MFWQTGKRRVLFDFLDRSIGVHQYRLALCRVGTVECGQARLKDGSHIHGATLQCCLRLQPLGKLGAQRCELRFQGTGHRSCFGPCAVEVDCLVGQYDRFCNQRLRPGDCCMHLLFRAFLSRQLRQALLHQFRHAPVGRAHGFLRLLQHRAAVQMLGRAQTRFRHLAIEQERQRRRFVGADRGGLIERLPAPLRQVGRRRCCNLNASLDGRTGTGV